MKIQPQNDPDFVFTQLSGVPSARSATFEEFQEILANWIARWCLAERRRKKETPAGYCAFVVDPSWTPTDHAKLQDHFKDDTPPKLQHNIRVTDYALNRVHAMHAQCDDLSATVAAIKALGLGARPFVIFDPESEQAWFYSEGAGGPVLPVKLSPANLGDPLPAGWADFEKLLQDIWLCNLRYPADHPMLWHDPKKFYPCRLPETNVQGLLYMALRNRFLTMEGKSRGVLIEKESHSNVGRADLRALNNKGDCYFAAEIKVAKSFAFSSKDGKPPTKVTAASQLSWVKEGINQADEYRLLHNGQVAVLLVYDMRAKKDAYTAVATECQAKDVKCRQYPLYTKRDSAGGDAKVAITIH
jgi:hypothetical protein